MTERNHQKNACHRHWIQCRAAVRLAALIVLAAGLARNAIGQAVVTAGGAREELPVSSLRAQRDFGVVKQEYDYSCGAAALATLLTYGLNDKVGEDTLLHNLLDGRSTAQIETLQKSGFSLLDLQKLAQQRGHKAQGFRIHADQLAKLGYPVIVFIQPHGYRHFAVLRGVRGDRAYLADPSLGNVRMPLYRFLEMWADKSGHGIIFAVERSDGKWPAEFALRLAGGSNPPIEIRSAEKLSEPFVLPPGKQR
jgi:predicted double-glycine peptidase